MRAAAAATALLATVLVGCELLVPNEAFDEVTPPEAPHSVHATLIAVWELEGIAGFWRMRSQNRRPEVVDWWAACDLQCVRRTRRFAVAPDDLKAMSAAGRGHA